MGNIILDLSMTWGDTISLVLVCFGMVLAIMILFVGIIYLFNLFSKSKASKAQTPEPKQQIIENKKEEEKISDAEYAAIATAVHLYFEIDHDEESNILTIKNIQQNYSPWLKK